MDRGLCPLRSLAEATSSLSSNVSGRRFKEGTVDLGASWLHGLQGNVAASLIDVPGDVKVPSTASSKLGALSKTEWGSTVFYGYDGPFSEEAVRSSASIFKELLETYQATPHQPEETAEQAILKTIDAMGDGGSKDPSMRRLIQYYLSRIESENAAALSSLSAMQLLDDTELLGGDHLIPGGAGRLPPLLTEGLDIRLQTTLKRVSTMPQGAFRGTSS